MMPSKKPWVAFLLSFLIPGAGLFYLGYWKAALVNLVLGTALATLVVEHPGLMGVSEHEHYALLVIASASAGVAHALSETWVLRNPVQDPAHE